MRHRLRLWNLVDCRLVGHQLPLRDVTPRPSINDVPNHSRSNSEEARQLQVIADAPDAMEPGLGEELRALALISLGYAQNWTARLDQAEHLKQGIALAPIRGLRVQDAQALDNLATSKDLLRLHTLNLRGAVLSADGSDAPVLFRSKYLANLTTLLAPGYDDNGQLDTAGLRPIAGTKHLMSLTHLDISDNWLFGGYNSAAEEAACRELLPKLGENMPALRELRLHGMGLGDGDVSGLVGQKWVGRLRVLDLSGNGIGETGCRALCKSKYLTRLERLDVAENEHRNEETRTHEPLAPATRQMLKKRFGKRVVCDSKRK